MADVPEPFFTNDPFGWFKIILFFASPILIIGAWVLRLVRSNERQELNGLGGRVKTIEERQSMLEGRFDELGKLLTAHQLATQAAVEKSQRDLTSDINNLALLIEGLTATVRVTNDLRKTLREERGG